MKKSKPVSKIVTIDDHELIRFSIMASVEHLANAEVVGQGKFGDDIATLTHQYQPDLLLLDIRMNYQNGKAVNTVSEIKRVRQLSPSTKIVIVSGFTNIAVIRTLFRNEIDGYLLKDDITSTNLPKLIQKMLDGEVVVSREIEAEFYEWRIKNHRLIPDPTERQLEVLNLIAQSPNLSVEQMAACLNIRPQSFKNHLSRLYALFEVSNRTACILRGIELGLIRTNDKNR